MIDQELPRYAAKGQRRKLDRDWLELLHRQGLPPSLAASGNPGPALLAALDQRLPAPRGLEQAIAEFNQGQYWQCHETLEELWMPEAYPLRLFYHGLIKAAVGLLHLQRHNYHGALIKLRDTEYTLAPFCPSFMGVDTGRLSRDVGRRLWLLPSEAEKVDWRALDQLAPSRIHLEA